MSKENEKGYKEDRTMYVLNFKIKWAQRKYGTEPRNVLIDWHVYPKISFYGAIYVAQKEHHISYFAAIKYNKKSGLHEYLNPFEDLSKSVIGMECYSFNKYFTLVAISKNSYYKSKIDFMLFNSPVKHEISKDLLTRLEPHIEKMKEKLKSNELYSFYTSDEIGAKSRLLKGWKLLSEGETVKATDYFFEDGYWLSVTFREDNSPIKPGDIIDKKMFVIRRNKTKEVSR